MSDHHDHDHHHDNRYSDMQARVKALETVLTNDKVHQAMIEATPLKRLGEPEDMALGALYLASPASAYVTGTVMEIHGGITTANLDLGLMGL